MKFAFLEFYLRYVMFSNARSASFLKDMRPVSLRQNAELMKSVFLKLHLTDGKSASFLKDIRPAFLCQNARSASLLRDTRPVSLLQNAGLMKSTSLKYPQANATISNAKSASLISRGMRLASQSQNARAASVLQNVNFASLNSAPLRLASRNCDARLTFAL